MSHDPGDEDRVDRAACPFCGRSLAHRQLWVTPLRDEPYTDWSLASMKPQPLAPDEYVKIQQLVTCRRESCKDEAKKIQAESFKSRNKKQRDAWLAQMTRLYDPPLGFKDRDLL